MAGGSFNAGGSNEPGPIVNISTSDRPGEIATRLQTAGCGTITFGRHVRDPNETPLVNLWRALLDRLQCGVPALGGSTGRLKGPEGSATANDTNPTC